MAFSLQATFIESITSQLITHDYPKITQYRSNPERLNLGSINQDSKGKQSRGSLAWLWRQTHDLESKSPKQVPRSRGLDSRPRHFLSSISSFCRKSLELDFICQNMLLVWSRGFVQGINGDVTRLLSSKLPFLTKSEILKR